MARWGPGICSKSQRLSGVCMLHFMCLGAKFEFGWKGYLLEIFYPNCAIYGILGFILVTAGILLGFCRRKGGGGGGGVVVGFVEN